MPVETQPDDRQTLSHDRRPGRVSVVIPAYNVEEPLAKCIASALEQSWNDKEVIVVDDGSTDDTQRVARSFGDRIRYVVQANAGQGAARNRGMELATGEFVAFLDADDYWLPGFLEKTVRFLQRHPQAVAVLTAWIKKYDEDDEQLVPPLMQGDSAPTQEFMIESFYRFWVRENHVQTGAITIRRSAMDQVGTMNCALRVSQDLEYWGLLASVGAWGFLPEPLYVNNSRVASRRHWLAKYATRRKLCPTIEQWQERLVSRIPAAELDAFREIRGRTAAGFVHMMINGRRDRDARQTILRYAAEMPPSRMVSLMRIAAGLGFPVWNGVCIAIRAKERWKARQLRRQAIRVTSLQMPQGA